MNKIIKLLIHLSVVRAHLEEPYI